MKKANFFDRLAGEISDWTGRTYTFMGALSLVIIWALLGSVFDYSDSWQLVINTGTTIITFLMVFLIQNAQDRDTKAMQLKLDELIHATGGAHNMLLDLEDLTEEQLKKIRQHYEAIAEEARDEILSPSENSQDAIDKMFKQTPNPKPTPS